MIPDDIKLHLDAVEQWLAQLGRMPRQPSGLTAEERKQLQAVNKAVEQLQRSGVPVPEDLRGLKLKLSARDVSASQDHAVEVSLKQIESLMQALAKTVKTARTVRDRLKATGQPGGPKKHYGVTLTDLIRAGFLSVEDRLELQWLKKGPVLKGSVQADGTVKVKTQYGWQRYDSLSTAASRVAGRSLNGWKHWRQVNNDGSTASLGAIRASYIKKEAES